MARDRTWMLELSSGLLVRVEAGEKRDPKKFEELPRWLSGQTLTRLKRVYYKNSRREAIRANCIQCCGSSREAKRCDVTDCALWVFRPGAAKGVKPPEVPPLEAIEEAMARGPEKVAKTTVSKTKRKTKVQAPSDDRRAQKGGKSGRFREEESAPSSSSAPIRRKKRKLR